MKNKSSGGQGARWRPQIWGGGLRVRGCLGMKRGVVESIQDHLWAGEHKGRRGKLRPWLWVSSRSRQAFPDLCLRCDISLCTTDLPGPLFPLLNVSSLTTAPSTSEPGRGTSEGCLASQSPVFSFTLISDPCWRSECAQHTAVPPVLSGVSQSLFSVA